MTMKLKIKFKKNIYIDEKIEDLNLKEECNNL